MERNTRLRNAAFAVLAAIGLGGVGTVIGSGLHRHPHAIADAHKSALVGVAFAAGPPQQAAPTPPQVVGGGPYSPNVGQTYPNRVLWGLTHIHTDLSADSGLMGITLGPDQLFESAMGHEVMTTTGLKFKLERPLDWLAITDHAEFLGLSGQLASANPELLANPTGKKWYDLSRGDAQQKFEGAWDVFQTIASAKDPINNPKLQVSAWAEAYEAAEKYNQPGVFTTLHGFEMDVRARRQQSSSHGHLPRQR